MPEHQCGISVTAWPLRADSTIASAMRKPSTAWGNEAVAEGMPERAALTKSLSSP